MTKFSASFAAAAILLGPGWAFAEVADSSTDGFTVKTTVTIQASPDEVYRRLVHNVGDWWSPQHTFFGRRPQPPTIDEKPMGCFCETLPGQGAVRHMEVLRFVQAKTLVLSGAMGPLQSLAVAGTMDDLSAVARATREPRSKRHLRSGRLLTGGAEYMGGACRFRYHRTIHTPEEFRRARNSCASATGTAGANFGVPGEVAVQAYSSCLWKRLTLSPNMILPPKTASATMLQWPEGGYPGALQEHAAKSTFP